MYWNWIRSSIFLVLLWSPSFTRGIRDLKKKKDLKKEKEKRKVYRKKIDSESYKTMLSH